MTDLVLTSLESGDGKTTVAAALAARLRGLGRGLLYFRYPGPGSDEDARFISRIVAATTRPKDSIPPETITLIEAASPDDARSLLTSSSAIPIVVARYRPVGLAEQILSFLPELNTGSSLIVLNRVPPKGERYLEQKVISALQAADHPVLGVLPEDPVLLGLSVGDLATGLAAEVLCADDQLDRPVEAVMVAAMSDEGGAEYFSRRSNKAVVCSGDRPDVQLPALATNTSCIVLTEGFPPDPTVFATAEEQGIPLLKVGEGTLTTLDRIADLLASARLRQPHKLARIRELAAQLDLAALEALLGPAQAEARP